MKANNPLLKLSTLFIITLLSVLVFANQSMAFDLIESEAELRTPYPHVTGVGFDGNSLFISSGHDGDGGTETIYKVDLNGNQISYYQFGWTPSNLCWDGQNFWVLIEHRGLDEIVKLQYNSDTDSFTEQLRFSPSVEAIDVEAMTYFNGNIWVTQDEGTIPKLYKLSATDGSLIAVFENDHFDDIDGLAYDGTYLWALNDFGEIMKIDTTNGNVVGGFQIASLSEILSSLDSHGLHSS